MSKHKNNKRYKKYKKKQKQPKISNTSPKKIQAMEDNTQQTWYFDAIDTLFFRESRPMDSLGNAELGSLFPPSARTLIGAVRTALGEANNIDWQDYRQQKNQHPLADLIGYADDFAKLIFSGVWIYKKGERLYPAPQNLMLKPEKKTETSIEREEVFFLTIAEQPTHCDLGNIRLAMIENGKEGSKPLSNIWLTEKDFTHVLAGHPPATARWIHLCPASKQSMNSKYLLIEEPRIGIARDNKTRSVEKGKLYQTKHIRLADDVQFAIDIKGIDPNEKQWQTNPAAFMRLGGEGRIASINVDSTPCFIPAPQWDNKPQKDDTLQYFALYLLSPLLINNCNENDSDNTIWRPLPDFKQQQQGEQKQTVWVGKINHIDLTLHSAITGKAHQEGGWDLINNRPKAVQSYIPAGSVFYCTTLAKAKDFIKALHGYHIGDETNLGRGKLAVGKWV